MFFEYYNAPTKPDWKIFKVLPKWAMILISFAFFTLCNIHAFHSSLMTVPQYMSQLGFGNIFGGLSSGRDMVLYWPIYLLSGVVPMLIFEALIHLYGIVIRMRFPHVDINNLKHNLRGFFVVANAVLALVQIMYFFLPLSIMIGTQVITVLVYAATLVLYFVYFAPRNLPKFLYGRGLIVFVSPYLGLTALLAVSNLILGLVM